MDNECCGYSHFFVVPDDHENGELVCECGQYTQFLTMGDLAREFDRFEAAGLQEVY